MNVTSKTCFGYCFCIINLPTLLEITMWWNWQKHERYCLKYRSRNFKEVSVLTHCLLKIVPLSLFPLALNFEHILWQVLHLFLKLYQQLISRVPPLWRLLISTFDVKGVICFHLCCHTVKILNILNSLLGTVQH